MPPRALIAGLISVAVVVTTLWSWRTRQAEVATRVTTPAPAPPAATEAPPKPALSTGPAVPPPQTQPHAFTLQQRFHDTDDLLGFVESIRDAAKAGDGDSAWWIYRAVWRCDAEYRSHFSRRGRILTLDEALQSNLGIPELPMDEARKLHRQCERMREARFAGFQPASDWMKSAASAGVPLARMELARTLLADLRSGAADPAGRARAQELALLALQSKDPAVLVAMADVAPWLASSSASGTGMDWVVAACQRGLDCGAGSQPVVMFCRGSLSCQPYEDLETVLRRDYGAEYDDFERRAREINQLIDQDRFDELGAWISARR